MPYVSPTLFGASYCLQEGVTAHTRTVFSKRMQPSQQRALVKAVALARECLNCAIMRAIFNISALSDDAPAPIFKPEENSFNGQFILQFNVESATGKEFKQLLEQFKLLCTKLLSGLSTPLSISDVNLVAQRNSDIDGYVTKYSDGRYGGICLNFDLLSPHHEHYVARTLVQQATYKFLGARNHADIHQVHERVRVSIKTEQMLNNASSIAEMVINTQMYLLR